MRMETAFRITVIVLLLYCAAQVAETRDLADAARVNAARAIDQAKGAAANAEQAYSEAYDAHQAALLCR